MGRVTRLEGRPGHYLVWTDGGGAPRRKKVEGDEATAQCLLLELEDLAARERAVLRAADEPSSSGAEAEVVELLTVRRLILQGPDGKPRAILDTNPSGEASFGLLDGAGTARVVLRVDDGSGGAVAICDAAGEPVLSLAGLDTEGPIVLLRDGMDARMQLAVRRGGPAFLQFADAAGRVKLAIGVGADGKTTIGVEDAPEAPAPPPSEPKPPEAE